MCAKDRFCWDAQVRRIMEDAAVEPRRPIRGPRGRHHATRGESDGLGLPGNGERTLTHAEQKWLLEQMAGQRKRPASPAHPVDAEAPDAPSRPPVIEPSPANDAAPSRRRVEISKRPPPRTPEDSFWSFG